MQGSSRANHLRRNQTDAERVLWYRLRGRRLDDQKFRRQVPIGPYIADFVCMSAGLIIELDGGQHAEQCGYDEARARYLSDQGFEILRFWNNDVFGNLDGVLETIVKALSDRQTGHTQ